ncbi:MAG: gliding motility-associated C-terminal domain-containing protein, partial [Bacteroidales bacterium]|nr:gliding motility-associated C-terminal domain-containing protein [Bacteroidales bacterium]
MVGSTVKLPNIAGTVQYVYYLQGANGCDSALNFVLTVPQPKSLKINQPDTICNNQPIILSLSDTAQNILWNTGESTKYITVSQSGTYFVEASDSGCIFRDTVEVFQGSVNVSITQNGDLCIDGEVELTAVSQSTDFLWNTGETTQIIHVTQPQIYSVIATGNGCIARDSIEITLFVPTVQITQQGDLCTDAQITLSAIGNAPNYLWNTGENTQDITVSNAGTYSVKAYFGNCIASDSILLNCECLVWIPNTFTPNGDGLNDVWQPIITNCYLSDYQLFIYDRWGQLLFLTTDPNFAWDGTVNGTFVEANTVYTYKLLLVDNNGTKKEFQGKVSV